jgi:hypothetical protein
VSRSSTEAEHRAMAHTVSELTWLQTLVQALGISSHAASLSCDNQAALHIANDPVFHERTKHVRTHFVPSNQQLADVFTKGLLPALHYNLISKLMYRPDT